MFSCATIHKLTAIETWLIFLPSFYSFFYGGTMGTYLSLHFSVRARALSSLLVREYDRPVSESIY
jgi:uncharacterized membrane protein YjjP (DUF1212 family)